MTPDTKQAIIYCRISDPKQAIRGDGLNSQETRCREYAAAKGFTVLGVFRDEQTGKDAKRPGMTAMLTATRRRPPGSTIVIVDDISRLARDTKAHWDLRARITKAGGLPESPSFKFGTDADSNFMENVMAGAAQHQREKNAEQTKNRMRARAQNGYSVFQAPVGYRYERVSGRSSMLKRREPQASIIVEALEGYANGRFEIQADVMRFLNEHPLFPRGASGKVTANRVTQILTQPLYAGYLEVADWGVTLRPAQHEALISFATFRQIQDRIAGIGRAAYRKNLNVDFPLRGVVACDGCSTPLTACWSKGYSCHYAYYLCPKRGCELYGKSIRRDVIEGEFEKILKSAQPTEGVVTVFRAIFQDHWNRRADQAGAYAKTLGTELLKIDRQVSQFLDRIIATDVPSVIAAYENQIKKLDSDKLLVRERMADAGRPAKSFDETVRTALTFLASPYNIWKTGSLEARRTVLKLAFADQLRYRRNEGFRTANLALPFKALGQFSVLKKGMARPEGSLSQRPAKHLDAQPCHGVDCGSAS